MPVLPGQTAHLHYSRAVHQAYSGELLLVSDIVGKHPLFQVKHSVLASSEVKRALVHLKQNKEKNPRLTKSAATFLPPRPPPCAKKNIHLQTVVDGRLPHGCLATFSFSDSLGGCSSTGAVRPRLLEVEDEMWAENVGDSETVLNNGQVLGSKEELIKDQNN